MTVALPGIENRDFYSPHYFEHKCEDSLEKELLKRWREEKRAKGQRTPPERLSALAERWFEASNRAASTRDAESRFAIARDFHLHLLEALGYQAEPDFFALGDAPGNNATSAVIPVLLRSRRDNRNWLLVVDTPWPITDPQRGNQEAETTDPLDQPPFAGDLATGTAGATGDPPTENLQTPRSHTRRSQPATWRELFDEHLFRLDDPPRFVLVLTGTEIQLLDRNKYHQGALLSFDLSTIFRRREKKALDALAGLIHHQAFHPDEARSAQPLHDQLDEASHKHAFAVSADLKIGVRRAVELLGNEAVHYRRFKAKDNVFSKWGIEEGSDALAEQLTKECLTWLYRLLFLFYVEARDTELRVVPMGSEVYRRGYSLEGLRDLELRPLLTERDRNGFYFHESLKKLFDVLNRGFPPTEVGHNLTQQLLKDERVFGGTTDHGMHLDALSAPLFDDAKLPILAGVRLRNVVLQEILQLFSLSAEKKRQSRGRISYAQLDIQQLGAVYEGILSYSGFFAREPLIEVARPKDSDKEAVWFVPESRKDEYKTEEIRKDEKDRPIRHDKGTFLFRLAGRNREKSASYYTPQVLTECLVKHSLNELLFEESEDGTRTRRVSADEMLGLTICEPAMGSSAFLIEAIRQLADHYLEARQEETGELLPSHRYAAERRRVMARLATNNCYGVDLNETAVELAKVSLWLATIHEGGKCPWFGLRLMQGNSLIGARRQVFKTSDLTRKGTKAKPNWLGLVPEDVGTAPHSEERPEDTVYHFLVPAAGMAAYGESKVLKELCSEDAERLRNWRSNQKEPFSRDDIERLVRLSDAVDKLFEKVTAERLFAIEETTDRIPVWGEKRGSSVAGDGGIEPSSFVPVRMSRDGELLVSQQEEVMRAVVRDNGPYRRLELVMDIWCSLFFWPPELSHQLPERSVWLGWLELILEGRTEAPGPPEQIGLFADVIAEMEQKLPAVGQEAAEMLGAGESTQVRLRRLRRISERFARLGEDYVEACGVVAVEELLAGNPDLAVVRKVAYPEPAFGGGVRKDTKKDEEGENRKDSQRGTERRFLHWELCFPEVFAGGGGFDLVLGNPPWIKLQWKEAGLLSEAEPTLALRKTSSSNIAKQRGELIGRHGQLGDYVAEMVEMEGTQAFLCERQNYPLLPKIQTNLYKCFITRTWELGSERGIAGFIHQEGVYDDPKGGELRTALYPRLAAHYQFDNKLRLFPEVGAMDTFFSLNVYRHRTTDSFLQVSNLLHPTTIESSLTHDGHGPVPGIKNEDNAWDLRGHRSRVLCIDEQRLELFAKLYDEPGTPALEARLPVVHSEEILRVLEKFAAQPRKLGDLEDQYFATEMWHETNAQKDGTIKRETRQPKHPGEWILQGPHFHVGTPFNKTPNEGCKSKGDYTAIDLTAIPDDYLPRTNYVPACDAEEYRKRTPKWRGRLVTDYYRHVNRNMLSPTGERTLINAIAPPGCAHIDPVLSVAFASTADLLLFSGLASSLCFDFFVKTTGKPKCGVGLLERLPVPRDCPDLAEELRNEVLRLHCHHTAFGDIAPSAECAAYTSDRERRNALVRLDVIGAKLIGLSIEELITIYRSQFPVLQQYERERMYDQHGRQIPTARTASGRDCVNLVQLAALLAEQTGFDIEQAYEANAPGTKRLLQKKVRLKKRDAAVLGIDERCTIADLTTTTEITKDGEEARSLLALRYSDPGLEPYLERTYPTPWFRCDREAEYRELWEDTIESETTNPQVANRAKVAT